MHAFGTALKAHDVDAAVAQLSDDVLFRSPVVYKPYQGRDTVAVILHAVSRVLEDFRYVREIGADGDSDQALVFQARVGDREIEGCDFLHVDSSGAVDELYVMVRPMSAALALAEAMKAQLAGAG
jgi:limonene-1,2-epoxide hydrolase